MAVSVDAIRPVSNAVAKATRGTLGRWDLMRPANEDTPALLFDGLHRVEHVNGDARLV